MALPRGIRNNNPGNLEWGDNWQGLVGRAEATDPRFCQFQTPAFGIRALARVLITYYDKRKAADGSRIDTIREVIERWAPAFENDTDAYVRHVGKLMCDDCVDIVDTELDLHDYETLRKLTEAIIRHENGKGPLDNINSWYKASIVEKGLELAGVPKPLKEVAKVPVTKETSGATATGATGVVLAAEAAPSVMQALKSAEGSLTSGEWGQMLLGLALVALAIFIAYGQVQKHKQGEI